MVQASRPTCCLQRKQTRVPASISEGTAAMSSARHLELDHGGEYVWSVDSASIFAVMPDWLMELTAPARTA